MRPNAFFLAALLAAVALSTVGCGEMAQVTGRVTFPDGKPLTRGQVIFTDDYYMARSDLDKNGEYRLHTLRRNDGIRKGHYRVYFAGTLGFAEDEGAEEEQSLDASMVLFSVRPLIDLQYASPNTSGFEVDVKRRSKFDFTVYKPGEVPPEARNAEARHWLDGEPLPEEKNVGL
ncbi:MAG: hypothetical protein HUK22_00650 [Thermoguttaceae bacterium]|nr:hypothetical protein [Thermoguttaceae bacterium]